MCENCSGVTEVSQEEWDKIMANIKEEKAERARLMPDETAALEQIRRAMERLKDLGFKDAVYCPKDGSLFDSIEAGSTGIHATTYEGDWPDGKWWIYTEGDIYPSRPIMWRPKKYDNREGLSSERVGISDNQ